MIGRLLWVALVWTLLASAGAADTTPPPLVFPKAVVVKAYLFEPYADGNSILSNFRKLNATAVPATGVKLTAAQIGQLRWALAPRPQLPQHPVAACFSPRHGFVFEDAQGRIVGTLDACFECLGVAYDAPGFEARVKPIYDQFPKTYSPADQRLQARLDGDVDRVRAEFGIPPSLEVVDWKALGNLVRELGLPASPGPADYQRLRAKAAP